MDSADTSLVVCAALRGVLEQACRERDKLRLELDLANQRNLQLVREVDDRHANMETLNESRIRSDESFMKGLMRAPISS